MFKVRQVWPLSKKLTMVKISKVQPFNLQNLLEVIKKRKRDEDKARAKMYDFFFGHALRSYTIFYC